MPHEFLTAAFTEAFGRAPEGVWWAPGVVDLLGERADEHGLALSVALPLGVQVAVARRADDVLEVRSLQAADSAAAVSLGHGAAADPPGTADVAGPVATADRLTEWTRLPVAVARALRGHGIGGASLLVDGGVPAGAGLGSSTALACAVAAALAGAYDVALDHRELARLTWRAETTWRHARTLPGRPALLADHAVVWRAAADHALLVDRRTGRCTAAPLTAPADDEAVTLLLVDTASTALAAGPVAPRSDGDRPDGSRTDGSRSDGGPPDGPLPAGGLPRGGRLRRGARRLRRARGSAARGPAGGASTSADGPGDVVAARRAECVRAAEVLGVAALREVTDLGSALRRLPDPVLRRRVRHVVTESHRVEAAFGLLKAARPAEVGSLLTASHLSARDQFDVAAADADVLVNAALRAGARGGRLVSPGGPVLLLAPDDRVHRIERALADARSARTGPAEAQSSASMAKMASTVRIVRIAPAGRVHRLN